MKNRMFEVVPLAEAIGKLDEKEAQKIRGDSAGKEEPPEIPDVRPHRSVRSEKSEKKAGARASAVGSDWMRG